MIVSTHDEYLTHLRQQMMPRLADPDITVSLETYAYECVSAKMELTSAQDKTVSGCIDDVVKYCDHNVKKVIVSNHDR